MRTLLLGISFLLSIVVAAQRDCRTSEYIDLQKKSTPLFQKKLLEIESFLSSQSPQLKTLDDKSSGSQPLIRIPVVVHILYNTADQNISDAQIFSQLNALNRDFRRLNADTVNTPERFHSLAADVQIEFVLATVDPSGRATKGIVRRYTSQTVFKADDKIKFNSMGGSDAWDTKTYLNIWVGNFQSVIGYSTVPGSSADIDGIVIASQAFGITNTSSPYNLGRTAVHEAGHWLGLKHIWGDQFCGDDGVDDTPQQGNFTPGCPATFRTSCNNGILGDMYMNYMDYTNDACVNLFTSGQKERMRAMFMDGGPRNSLLHSKGLSQPWNLSPEEIIEEYESRVKVYPNPAVSELTINLGENWIGSRLSVTDIHGRTIFYFIATSRAQKINLQQLKPGVYFVTGENQGSLIRKKFIRL